MPGSFLAGHYSTSGGTGHYSTSGNTGHYSASGTINCSIQANVRLDGQRRSLARWLVSTVVASVLHGEGFGVALAMR